MSSEASHFDSALEAMSADELRVFLREFSRGLEPKARGHLHEALMECAARGPSGGKPEAPPNHVAARVEQFIAAARQVGVATPDKVDELLREGNRAFRAGDMPAARAILGPLLSALAEAEFDLGQDETYDEVLTESLHDCAARFLVAVYMTTPLAQRAEVLREALEAVDPASSFLEPLRELEQVTATPLPELDAFLPSWVSALQSKHISGDEAWESPSDQRLREAVTRAEGLTGLERLARTSKQPEALQAWCGALVERGQWKEALHAFETAASLVGSKFWRGTFLDGAALATHELGRGDLTQRLATAWRAAPCLTRLLRSLNAGDPSATTLKKRASSELAHAPTKSPRLLGVLHLMAGDFEAAARLLAAAPGLGWSEGEHPGHVLFPAFAWLLGEAPEDSVRAELVAPLRRPPGMLSDMEELDPELLEPPLPKPALPTPTLVAVLQRGELARHLTPTTRQLLRDALRQAAKARVTGVLREKRRRHYEHAAQLVACCVELEHASGEGNLAEQWAASLRADTKRFPAFQASLQAVLPQVHPARPHGRGA